MRSLAAVKRTLEGTLVGASPGRASVALLTGTGTAQPKPTGLMLDGHRMEAADLAAELPAHFAFSIDAHRLDPDPAEPHWGHQMQGAYRGVVFDALPRRLPTEAVGRGARWKVVPGAGDQTTSLTWTLTAIDGNTVTLTAKGASDAAYDREVRAARFVFDCDLGAECDRLRGALGRRNRGPPQLRASLERVDHADIAARGHSQVIDPAATVTHISCADVLVVVACSGLRVHWCVEVAVEVIGINSPCARDFCRVPRSSGVLLASFRSCTRR